MEKLTDKESEGTVRKIVIMRNIISADKQSLIAAKSLLIENTPIETLSFAKRRQLIKRRSLSASFRRNARKIITKVFRSYPSHASR
jgi:hypothetical protein